LSSFKNHFIEKKSSSLTLGEAKPSNDNKLDLPESPVKKRRITQMPSQLLSPSANRFSHSTPSLSLSSSSAVAATLTLPKARSIEQFRRPTCVIIQRGRTEQEEKPVVDFLKRKRNLSPVGRSQSLPAPLALDFSSDDLRSDASPLRDMFKQGECQRAQSPSNQFSSNPGQLKRTRVSVDTEGLCKRRKAKRACSEPALSLPSNFDRIGAPCTPPSCRSSLSCSSSDSDITDSLNEHDTLLEPTLVEESILTEKDTFLSPMSRRIIAAAGMRRFGDTMPLDCLKDYMPNVGAFEY
jgi:hypothetical protein